MNKQLLGQEAIEKYPVIMERDFNPMGELNVDINEGKRAAYIAGATSSSTVKTLQSKVDFYRQETDKCREFVFGRNDIGEPCQPIWDAVHNKLQQQESTVKELEREVKRLKGLLDDIAKGERMLVNRTGVGEYTVVFKGGEDVKKYYEENDFENNL